jgi:hypothetical protein
MLAGSVSGRDFASHFDCERAILDGNLPEGGASWKEGG